MWVADTTNVEHSQAVANFGQILTWIFIGLVVMWVIANVAKRVESQLMPSIPILIGAGFVGVLAIGMFRNFGF